MPIAQKVRADGEPGSYQDVSQDQVYAHDMGVIALPVAGVTPAVKLIRLHAGIASRTVKWRVARGGRPPLIPAAADTNGDTLLQTVVAPSLPRPNTQTGSYDWDVSGEYTYVQNTPRVAGVNAFPAGNHPYIVAAPAIRAVQELPPGMTSFGFPADRRADAQTEYLSDNGYDVRDATFTAWPLTVHPASYTSTHLIGG